MPGAAFKTVQTRWDPSRLNAGIASAFPTSVKVAIGDAKAHSPSSKAGATGRVTSSTTAYLKPTGLGHVFEKGRRGGYLITPGGVGGASRRGSRTGTRVGFKRAVDGQRNQALKFRDGGGYASSAVGGSMSARPYIAPAGQRWAMGGYQLVARRTLLTRGFR